MEVGDIAYHVTKYSLEIREVRILKVKVWGKYTYVKFHLLKEEKYYSKLVMSNFTLGDDVFGTKEEALEKRKTWYYRELGKCFERMSELTKRVADNEIAG